MSMRNFIVRDRKTMYKILQALEQEAKLVPKKDFAIISIPQSVPGYQSAKFWIESRKLSHPLVKKIMLQNRLL